MTNEISLPQSYRVYDHEGGFVGHASRFFFDETNDFNISIRVDRNDHEELSSHPTRSALRDTITVPYSFLQSDDEQATMILRAPFTAEDVALYQGEALQANALVEQYMIEDYSESKRRSGVISLF